jgi:HAD superfamily hydrolase (TIGR01490 family)
MKRKLALFDLDHTLIPLDSDFAWGQFTTSLGWTDAHDFIGRNDTFYQQYKGGTLDITEYVRFATAAICAQGATKSEAAREEYMGAVIHKAIQAQALDLVRAHQASDDAVVIITATNEFVTRPIAAAFGVSELIAIDLQRDPDTGWFTGEIAGTPSFREGKVARMDQWLAHRGWCWDEIESTFYSDSINDLPLLEKVTHPVATNPDERLRTVALARGWRILDLFQEDAAA